MSIEALSAVSLLAAAQPGAAPAVTAPAAVPEGSFRTMLDGIEQLNTQIGSNDQAIQQLALGNTDNLHQLMMNLERTRLTFELMLQVRNKALEAYQELMRMQV
jgi:flagellar hook-basal body complex protein FliE